jgi:hypothetical protein
MPWVQHDLGGIDLLDDTAYLIDESSGDPEPKVNDEYQPLRSSDGARLSFDQEAEYIQTLVVICVGDTLGEAQDRRQDLVNTLQSARNSDGQTLTYSFQEDATAALSEWWLVGGRCKFVLKIGGVQLFGAGGRYVAGASVTLGLSKG